MIKADVEVFFEVPVLEEAEFLDPTGVDPQLLCSNENASSNGRLGPFGLLTLASKDLTEQTAIFFRVFRGPSRYIVLMCSDQSRLNLSSNLLFFPLCSEISLNVYAV
jgi:beta-fructofuranosidase